jgi:hypothetical protein
VHPEQTETFHVLEGEMTFRLGRRKIVAGPGETVEVPAGAIHKFANKSGAPVRARVEIRPALKMEELFETTVELAHEGRTNRKGMPKPVHLALFVRQYAAEVRAPFPPPNVVAALMAPLAWYGRKRGHAARYGELEAPAALQPRVA